MALHVAQNVKKMYLWATIGKGTEINPWNRILSNNETIRSVDLIILDMQLPRVKGQTPAKEEGESLLNEITLHFPGKPLMVSTTLKNIKANPEKLTPEQIDVLEEKWRTIGGLIFFKKESRTKEQILRDTVNILTKVSQNNPDPSSRAELSIKSGTLAISTEQNVCVWQQHGKTGSGVAIKLTPQAMQYLVLLAGAYKTNPG